MGAHLASRRVGRTVGKYTLVRLLGTGGMAVVYEATHRNGHRVALKMLKPEISVAADVRSRFAREGYAANKVQHPGAVRVLDDDVTSDGLPFLVMELLEGCTLEALAKARGGKLPARTVAEVGKQVLDVLVAAHAAAVVHRDLKPENVFLQTSGAVKVLDFGIARVTTPREGSSTATGRMLGTPAFMPPEQAYGRRSEIDAQSDVWAVGATLFTALAGRVVHEAPTAEETLIMAATTRAPRLASVVDDVPEAIAAVVDRALAPEKPARFGSAAEMARALESAYAEAFGVPCPTVVQLDEPLATPPVTVDAAPARTTLLRKRVALSAVMIAASAAVLGAVAIRRAPRVESVTAATTASSAAPVASAPAAPPATTPETLAPPPPRLEPEAARVKTRPPAPAPARVAVAAEPVTTPPSAEPAPAKPGVCGFEIDEEGRKWPKRCP